MGQKTVQGRNGRFVGVQADENLGDMVTPKNRLQQRSHPSFKEAMAEVWDKVVADPNTPYKVKQMFQRAASNVCVKAGLKPKEAKEVFGEDGIKPAQLKNRITRDIGENRGWTSSKRKKNTNPAQKIHG